MEEPYRETRGGVDTHRCGSSLGGARAWELVNAAARS